MSDRRTSRPSDVELGPDAPPTEEELAASQRLREALEAPSAAGAAEDPDVDLVRSLRAAWHPSSLEAHAHAELVGDLPESAEEAALAAELREALDVGSAPDLVRALRAGLRPEPLPIDEHRAIVARALGAVDDERRGSVLALQPRARPARLALVTTTAVLALAASVVVWISSADRSEAPLAKARSTQPLFDEPFKAGETSARIDRIAVARSSDYRDNRFAKWGVR